MEKQLEALNIDDSFESELESPRRIIRTFSFPSSQIHCFKAPEELKSPKLDRHYSEQIIYPNIYARRPAILSEMEARIKKAEYIFYDNSKVPDHIWPPRIDKAPSIPAPMPADNQVEYMEVEKYPDSLKSIHDATSSTSAPMETVDRAEAMEVEKFMDSTNPAGCIDLSKTISIESLSFAAVIAQAHTTVLRSVFNLESQPAEADDDTRLIPTRRKLWKTSKTQNDNTDYTNENVEDDEKRSNYQDTKEEIRPKNASKCSKVKQALRVFFVAILLFVLLFFVPLQDDQNDKHSNTFATAVVELKKQIFGQDRAIEVLTDYIPQDSPSLKIIALVGGTGVGKSYTAEIIRKNFHERSSNRLFFSRADLFVLENLREEHLLDTIKFVKTHQETYGHRYGTILAIFNVEQMSDDSTRSIDLNKSISTIRSTFADANLDIKVIPYEPLSEETLEKCIIDVAKNIKKTLSRDQIALIKQQLIENNTGCKGAYGKVQVIGRQ
ncbi:uncharacterized protein LOC115238167 [Formica exsecta]|uniref:uncharacterized protein LOC115238167 n=1 Tax=Formica exsecta TaxID=72781 RepID=UPI001143A063|nr:uncharacterized protein LOC115238167 [Formica exsecta]XP_029667621.1 uncharacterized protein LOC115238167 [Formica exsecta]XP_029667622.1 uncharacterized protein LOC115238167 [Formica exsecta]XP_029667623.1 uncharacterized protein LOC115238167 [Formica exsecta]